jgi:AraC-like DNA-binding protein
MSAEACGIVHEVVACGSLAAVGRCSHDGGWAGDPDEEWFDRPVAIITTAGRWSLHGRHGAVDIDEGVVVFGHAGESYRCSHPSGPYDRTLCVTMLGDYELPARGWAPRRPDLERIASSLARADSPLRVDALALTLLAELHELSPTAPRLDARRRRLVALAQEHLARNLEREVTLAELASAVHASPFHLHRVFRAATGITPHAYLTQLRVERACELLRDGWSVGETALAVGFRSRGHLARVFRTHTGVYPSRYV